MSTATAAYVRLLLRSQALLARCLPEKALSRMPGISRARRSVRQFAARVLVPSSMEWVQVQDGFAKDLWIRIDLARERSWCRGQHEPATQCALQHALGAHMVLYDIGAHIGLHALPAARAGAQVIAFEPDPESAARLRAHAERNNLSGNIRVVEAAVWSGRNSRVDFRRGTPRSQGGVCSNGHRPVLASGEVISLQACSIDEFVAGGAPAPHIVKIDVEGGESEVLNGALTTLRRARPILLIEVHTSSELQRVQEVLQSASYTLTWDIPPEGFPRQCFATPAKPA
jgi:FkbM family methyltransferase